jgi:hypothetical protein
MSAAVNLLRHRKPKLQYKMGTVEGLPIGSSFDPPRLCPASSTALGGDWVAP